MNTDKWEGWARRLVFQAGLNSKDLYTYGIGYDKGQDILVLPIRYDGELLGYQYRQSPGSKQKYITNYLSGIDGRPHVCYPIHKLSGNAGRTLVIHSSLSSSLLRGVPKTHPSSKHYLIPYLYTYSFLLRKFKSSLIYKSCVPHKLYIVICEDILSYVKLSKLSDKYINPLCLLGTSIKANDLSMIRHLFKPQVHVVIYLDDDNLQVKQKQLQLKDHLSMYVPASRISIHHSDGVDPKNTSLPQLYKNITQY